MKLTEYLAIYAAIMSSVVFFWNVRKSRPNFRVKVSHGIGDQKDGTKTAGFVASVENMSAQTVFIKPISILIFKENPTLKDRWTFLRKYKRYSRTQGWVFGNFENFDIEQDRQNKLEPGQSFSVFIPASVCKVIAEHSKSTIFRAYAQNELGENRYSKDMEIPEAWIQGGTSLVHLKDNKTNKV